MPKTLSNLPIGAKIKHPGMKYDGKVINWIKVTHDGHYTPGETIFITEDLISKKAFDAEEPKNSNSDRRGYGNNNYELSNIDQWLNSTSKNWYSARHRADQAPTSSYVSSNPYADEAGFLFNFTDGVMENIRETTIRSAKHSVDGGGITNLKRKIFLMSRTEAGLGDEFSGRAEGKPFPYFTSSEKRKASSYYWLRTPHADAERRVRLVDSDGWLYPADACGGGVGVRPALSFPSSVLVTSQDTNGVWEVVFNRPPTISDNTSSNRTLYEGDVITLNGNVKDEDKGDVVTVRYIINNGTTRALSSQISQRTAIPYNKTLTFKEGYLYDRDTKVSGKLSDGTKHLVKLWAEDDKGGKSEEVLINFYVVNNRPARLTINDIIEQNDLIDTDTIQITGNVSDPDKNETTLLYKVNSGGFTELNSGMDREFEVRIQVSRFHEGDNTVTIRARDEFGAITDKVVKIHKDMTVIPLKTAIREYKMLPPEGKAKGILLWIQRETGDLTTKVEIKFGSSPYKTLESDNTAPVGAGIEEDEYYYENDKEESDIRLRITMERSSLSSTKGIKLISGVFN